MVATGKPAIGAALAVLCASPAIALDLPPECAGHGDFTARYACVTRLVSDSMHRVDDAFARYRALSPDAPLDQDNWHRSTAQGCAATVAGMTSESADLILGTCIINRNNARIRALSAIP